MGRFIQIGVVATLFAPTAIQAGDKYRIGIPKSLFCDVPPSLVEFASLPFQELFKERIGLEGEIVQENDAMTVARKLDEGKLALGVLQGHEFAWARDKYPDLEAIVCAVNRPKEIQALILVRYDNEASRLREMKQTKLAIASNLKDFGSLFLERQRADELGDRQFTSVQKTATVHESLQKVIAGQADLAIADLASWSYFVKLYPGPSQNLKVLARSPEFPRSVLVYKRGATDANTINRIRTGFLNAHKNVKAARLMTGIKIERFDAVPDDYEDTLKACLKAYPKPLSGD